MGMVALLTMSAYAYLDWFERLDFRESDDPPAILQDPPPELGAAISKPSEFRVEMSVSAIPLAVRQGLSEGSGREFEMAEPGGRWEKTDAGIAFWSLPHQRLFSIASSKEFCIVFYEFGGFGSRYSIEAFRLGKNAATLVFTALLKAYPCDARP